MLLCNFQCQQKKKITGVSQCIELRASSSVVIVFWAGWAEQIRKKKHRVEFFQHYLLSVLLLLLLSHFSVSDSVRPQKRQPTRLPLPSDSPGKNTGVCCHFLLQCMKVKSESEVAQSCPTLSDPMDCSLAGSSVHGIFQARVLEWGAIAFSVSSLAYSNIFRRYSPKSQPPLNNTYVPSMTTAKIYRINYNFINFLIH